MRLIPTAILAALPGMTLAGSLTPPVADPVIVPVAPAPVIVPGNALRFTIGAGISGSPGYFGADEMEVGPTGTFRFEYLRFGSLEFGNPDPNAEDEGLSFGASFRYVPERTSDDYAELDGLDDVDATFELGGSVAYTTPLYEVSAELRYGLGGHESFVAELGADVFHRPTDRLELSLGPRLLMGDSDYARTYFGVTEDEAGASDFDAYDPQGGLLTAGVEFGATYELTDLWGLEGNIRYDRYIGDAADSPIVQSESDDQVSLDLLVTRRFDFSF